LIKLYKQCKFILIKLYKQCRFQFIKLCKQCKFRFLKLSGKINGELSDRIGFPASLYPLVLPSGVYIPIKAQELEIAEVAQIVGAHTGAIFGIEQQILGIVGVGGGGGH